MDAHSDRRRTTTDRYGQSSVGGRRSLILVKHSLPEIEPGLPAAQWRLSDEGRRRAEKLAEKLSEYGLTEIVSSREPKAVETGQILATRLGLPFSQADGLHEHERPAEPFHTREAFEARVRQFFERPNELVFGAETAAQAEARFLQAVDQLTEQHPRASLGVIAHGTVISLLAARRCRVDPFPLWQHLGLPSFLVLSLPDFTLKELIENL